MCVLLSIQYAMALRLMVVLVLRQILHSTPIGYPTNVTARSGRQFKKGSVCDCNGI